MSKGRIEDIYPLSPMQQGMLFHALATPDSDVYVRQVVTELPPGLDPDAFELAWEYLLEHHPALRTCFLWERAGEPLQAVIRGARLKPRRLDWRQASPADQRSRLSELVEQDLRAPFQLNRPPLMRVSLMRLSESRWCLLWTYHHLIFDGWSLGRVMEDLAKCYKAAVVGEEPELLPARPYADYIAWLGRQDEAAAEAFWRRELQGFDAATPVDLERVEVQALAAAATAPFHNRSLRVPAPVWQALDAQLRRRSLTLGTLVYGLWGLLLSRYSGQRDVVFGAIFSGRPQDLEGAETMVGLLINTLPLRIRLPRGAAWWSWLEELQVRRLELHQFEHSPLAEVQRWSEVEQGTPLFHSVVAVENFPRGELLGAFGEGTFDVAEQGAQETTNYPITLLAEPGATPLLRFALDAKHFHATGAERLRRHLLQLLSALADCGEAVRLDDLSPLTAAERQQLLREWNDTVSDYDRDELLHEPFEVQARQRPDAVAGLCGQLHLSYGELERRSSQLAGVLAAFELGRSGWVGIHLARSLEMLIALLAISKAGCAYVPLSSTFPAARRAWILESLGSRCLLTTSDLVAAAVDDGVPPPVSHLLCLDDADQWLAPRVSRATPRPGDAGDLAYVIFTSGSSGTPKGVMVRHRPVSNLNKWIREKFDVGPHDRMLLLASLTFDLSVYDIFGILGEGGLVHVATDEEVDSPARQVEILLDQSITFWDTAPAALQQLVPYFPDEPPQPPPSLRLAFQSGDWIPIGLPDAVRRVFPYCRFMALGGATEATVWSNNYTVRRVADHWVSIPYGRPIPNARYHVLDDRLRPCAIGVPGDLYIGGPCLASGYAGDPRQSAGKFLPDPFAPAWRCSDPATCDPDIAEGGCIYRTGDRARHYPDGNLEFLGRVDHQVKVRGFRIELGEIEAALAEHPEVRNSLVLPVPAELGYQALSLFVEPKRPQAVTSEGGTLEGGNSDLAGELRRHLEQRLPAYMVPTHLLLVPAIPVTSNGKVDRPALLALQRERLEAAGGGERMPPRSPLELELVTLWQEALGRPVGLRDSFFELGGHSLLAVRLLAAVRKRFGVELPLTSFLEAGTVEALALRIEQGGDTRPFSPLVPLQAPPEGEPALYLVHGGLGSVLEYLDLAKRLAFFHRAGSEAASTQESEPTTGVTAVQPFGLRSDQQRLETVEAMAQAYLQAIRQAQPSGPYRLGGYSFGGHVAYEMARRLEQEEKQSESDAQPAVEVLVILDTLAPALTDPPPGAQQVIAWMLEQLCPEALASLPAAGEDEQLVWATEELKRRGVFGPAVDVIEVRRYLDLYLSNLQAVHSFHPLPYSGDIIVFHTGDPVDPTLGWGSLTSGRVTTLPVPGEHFQLLRDPALSRISEELHARLPRRLESE